MGFKIPDNALLIMLQVSAAVTKAMTEAETAFSGHGTGEKKKAFVMERARDLMKTQDLAFADLMTKVQEDAVLVTFDKGVEFFFSTWATAKLFKTPTVPPGV